MPQSDTDRRRGLLDFFGLPSREATQARAAIDCNTSDLIKSLKCEIKHYVGEGAFAFVFAGLSEEFGKVAIKIFKNGIQHLSIFRAERDVLNLKNFPTDVGPKLYAVSEESAPQLFLIMEFVDGHDLERYVKDRALKAEEIADLLETVATALERLRIATGRAHLDIHPGNIKVTSEGNIRILDYGCSGPDYLRTGVRRQTGNYGFTAPEVQRNERGGTSADDVFSVAALGYTLFTGQLFLKPGEAEESTLTSADPKFFERPRKELIAAKTPFFLRRILLNGLQRRYSSHRVFANRLRRWRVFRRCRLTLAAALAGMILCAAYVTHVAGQYREEARAKEEIKSLLRGMTTALKSTAWILDAPGIRNQHEALLQKVERSTQRLNRGEHDAARQILAEIETRIAILKDKNRLAEIASNARASFESALARVPELVRLDSKSDWTTPYNDAQLAWGTGDFQEARLHFGQAAERVFVWIEAHPTLAIANTASEKNAGVRKIDSQIETWTNSIDMEFVTIPAGTFVMGSSLPLEEDDEFPHEVEITKPLFVSRTEVTEEAYHRVLRTRAVVHAEKPLRPVAMISWYDAVEWCNALSDQENLPPAYRFKSVVRTQGAIDSAEVEMVTSAGYRLPTEAEWEWCARAGAATKWFFGDEEHALTQYAWHKANSGDRRQIVGSKLENGFGLCDVSGNVSEWVFDYYDASYYHNSPAKDPIGPAAGNSRVVRGGSFLSVPSETRSAYRNGVLPTAKKMAIGFRVCRSTE